MPDSDEDLLRTAEVAAIPMEEEEHATVPIDVGPPIHPPPLAARSGRPERRHLVGEVTRRFETLPLPDPLPLAVPSAPPPGDEGWLDEDTSLTRETEKTLSVPAKVSIDRATVTIITGLNAGQVFALDGYEHVVGRGTEADVWVEDPAISRRHARFVRRPDGRFMVEDLGSTNGTFVSGRRIDPRAELTGGDRVQIGPSLILRFAVTDDAEEELQRRLYESSTRDALTRAFNRKYLSERMLAEIAHARRHKTQLGLLMLDLDRFKEINDGYGHLAGDMVLRVVAAQIQRLIRVEDVLARYGGEEFVILVRSTSHRDVGVLAERVRVAVEALQIAVQGTTLAVTTSIGIASLGELSPESGASELVAMADARLYRAKVGGRNRVCSED